MKKKKAVISLSGGLDSTTALYKALSEGFECYPVLFDYGQKHKKELNCAKEIAKRLKLNYQVVDLKSITKLIDNSSLTSDIPVPHGRYNQENMTKTIVPNRNMILYSIVIGYAINIKANKIVVGVHTGDHFIYPDCRPNFIKALELTSLLGNEGFYQPDFGIYAPFINLTKADIVKIGIKLNVPYEKTWSCYEGKERPCLKCGTCTERTEAFLKNNFKDPLLTDEEWKKAVKIYKFYYGK